MAAKSVKNMSDSELMKEWTSLGKQVQKDKERLREFSREHQLRNRMAQLGFTEGDADLLQEAAARGIETQEQVN